MCMWTVLVVRVIEGIAQRRYMCLTCPPMQHDAVLCWCYVTLTSWSSAGRWQQSHLTVVWEGVGGKLSCWLASSVGVAVLA